MTAFQIPYLHFTAIALCFLLFSLIFWLRRFRWLFAQLRRKWNSQPFEPRLLTYYKNAVWFWSIFVVLGILLFCFSVYLTRFQFVGSKVESIGQAIHHGSRVEFLGINGTKQSFETRGGQIAAAGLFLRFPRWMRFLGLENYHQLIAFQGIQDNQYHYGKVPDPQWVKPHTDFFVHFLYKNRESWKVPECTYKESVYFGGGTHRVLITRDGYIIQ